MTAGEIALRGEMGSVRGAARNISKVDGLHQAMTLLGQGIQHVHSAGHSLSLTQLAAVCRPLETRAQRIATIRAAVGQTLTNFANRVEVLQQDARRLRADLADLHAQRTSQSGQLAGLASAAPDTPERSRKLTAQIRELDARASRVEQQLLELDHARQAENRRCASQVTSATAALNCLANGSNDRSTLTGSPSISLAGFTRTRPTQGGTDKGPSEGNWWDTALALAMASGILLLGSQRRGGEEAFGVLQDALGHVGNFLASLPLVLVNHPDLLLELLGGFGLIGLGLSEEVGGLALDLTGVGAAAGIPLNIAGIASIAGGIALIGSAVPNIMMHATGDEAQHHFSTDNAGKARARNEPNPRYPGRDVGGRFTKKGNEAARADAKAKEEQGLRDYEAETGRSVDPQQVKAKVRGVEQGRYYDGLAKKADGTYEGIEVKSGGASRSPEQRQFDNAVSEKNPAEATLRGKKIKITSVDERKVK